MPTKKRLHLAIPTLLTIFQESLRIAISAYCQVEVVNREQK